MSVNVGKVTQKHRICTCTLQRLLAGRLECVHCEIHVPTCWRELLQIIKKCAVKQTNVVTTKEIIILPGMYFGVQSEGTGAQSPLVQNNKRRK